MGFWNRLGGALVEAFPPAEMPPVTAFVEAAGSTVGEDAGWRRITGTSNRDLTPMKLDRMRRVALWLWERNPLANRIIELPLAYLLAEGVSLTSKDEGAKQALDRFWKDPINMMDLKLEKKIREMAIYGEQCWPVFVAMDGLVRLGYLDPEEIETVVTDPDNIEQPIGIVTVANRKGVKRRYRVIVLGPETVFASTAQAIRATMTDGDCFYFNVNGLSNGVRGRSDLLASADMTDGYEKFVYGEMERAEDVRRFIWDVTLKGMTPEQVKARAAEITIPRNRGIRVHNDSEEWGTLTPNLNAADNAEAARLFRNHALGAATIPEHWYGGGGDVNRATAGAMADPIVKVMTRRQQYWKVVLEIVAGFVIWRATDPAGTGDPTAVLADPNLAPAAVFPELNSKDIGSVAQAFAQVVGACATAVAAGLLSSETAIATIALIAGLLGLEIDAAAELERAQEEAAKRAEQDVFTAPPDDPAAADAGRQGAGNG